MGTWQSGMLSGWRGRRSVCGRGRESMAPGTTLGSPDQQQALLVEDAALGLVELAQALFFVAQLMAPAVPVVPRDDRDDARRGAAARAAVARPAGEHLHAGFH